jgi:hypothetical protein
MEKRRSEEREKKIIEDENYNKLQEEEDIVSDEKWKEYGKTDIGCLYD